MYCPPNCSWRSSSAAWRASWYFSSSYNNSLPKLNDCELIEKVIRGVKFEDGVEVIAA